jgi:hypothetical protein
MSDTDRLAFIRKVLNTAPAGQFSDLLEDIQKISKMDGDLLKTVEQEYRIQVCISPQAEESNHPLAAPLRQALEAYQNGYDSSKGVTARKAILPGEDATNQVLIRTYTERVDEEKCRTGSLTAEWTVQSSEAADTQLSGQVNLCVFSYEDGNIQMRSTKDFPRTPIEDDDVADAIVNQISAWEADVLGTLKESYNKVSADLRAIRGILPIHKTRLDWSLVTQRTVRNLQETINK